MKSLNNVFILGDSYSTYHKCIPDGYSSWYAPHYECNDVDSAADTWWYQLMEETASTLVLNCSWSGTTICYTGYNGTDCTDNAFIARLDKLIEEGFFDTNHIDTFIVLGATNDFWAGSPLGEMKDGNYSKNDLYNVLPAIDYMLRRIRDAVRDARIIVVVNTELGEIIPKAFADASAKYGADCVMMRNLDKNNGHPTALGMRQIKDQILEIL